LNLELEVRALLPEYRADEPRPRDEAAEERRLEALWFLRFDPFELRYVVFRLFGERVPCLGHCPPGRRGALSICLPR